MMTPISNIRSFVARDGLAQQGFTLMELLVVLAIISLCIGLFIPNIAVSDNSAFNAEVRKAVSALNYARRIAIVQAVPAIAEFRTDSGEESEQDDRHSLWSNEQFTLSFQDEFQQVPETTSALALTFFPQGGSTGGTLYFDKNQRRAMIRVDPITGRIAVAYNGEELEDAF